MPSVPFRTAGALWYDLRHSLRGLVRRPLLVGTIALTLALGIGANTAVFSVVQALLLQPLPYATPDRLVAIWPGQMLANRELDALRERARTLDQVAGFSPGWLMALTGEEVPLQLNAARVTGNMFPLLGVPPLLGRTFGPEAEPPGGPPLAVLSYPLWQSAFHADSGIVGRFIRLDGEEYAVVGVMPRGFQMFDTGSDLWTPLTMDRAAMTWTGATVLAYGRLAPGRTAAMAGVELAPLLASLGVELDKPPDWARGAAVVGLRESLVGSLRPTLLVLLSGAAMVLLIAAANIANLLLVRATERQPELALRIALGAAPGRIATGLVLESLVLGLAGGALGAGLAVGGVTLLPRILPADLPRLGEIAVNGPVLTAAAGITLLTAVLFGAAPALQVWTAGRSAAITGSRTIAGGGQRIRGIIVTLAVALALVLGIGTALMARTLVALTRVDPGFRPDHVLTLRLQPTGYDSPAALRAYWREVLGRVRGIPGVIAAGTMLHLPLSGRTWSGDVAVEGRDLPPGRSPPRTAWQVVSEEGLRALGVPLLAGRWFSATDDSISPTVVAVNQAFVRAVFPGEGPLGRRISAGRSTGGRWATIVAVVGDMRHDSVSAAAGPEIYLPFEQRIVWSTSLILRTSGDPAGLAAAVRERIWSVNPQVPIANLRTLDDVVSHSLQRPRLVLLLLAGFALGGLVLGAVGIYGVVAYGARQRAREIGVRVALGATPSGVIRLVVAQGLGYAGAGVVLGLILAWSGSRLMRTLVFGIAPTDPVSFVAVPLGLLLTAVIASLLPARRAARADPVRALRE